MRLKVREIFYSIQGEGARQGEASIFIRLADCNLNCWFCDTDWSYGTMMSIDQIKEEIAKYPCGDIVWTGGEPTMQLTDEVLKEFPSYYHCLESNGTNAIPELIDYVVVAPKDAAIHRSITHVEEIRIPLHSVADKPNVDDYPIADNYYVSPIFLGKKKERFVMDDQNVKACFEWVLQNPEWKLSLQVHKLINVR